MSVVIGVDPDSEAHGVAVYEDGKLIELLCIDLMSIYKLICQEYGRDVDLVSIENVCGNNSVFRKVGNGNVQASMGRRLGKVQQSQIELERMLESIDVRYIRCKISKNWKSQAGKELFRHVTGWKGRSNEDTRSAAYFGWLHAKKSD